MRGGGWGGVGGSGVRWRISVLKIAHNGVTDRPHTDLWRATWLSNMAVSQPGRSVSVSRSLLSDPGSLAQWLRRPPRAQGADGSTPGSGHAHCLSHS